MNSNPSLRPLARALAGAFLGLAAASAAQAQATVKIGMVATLEGPFAVLGQDADRGAELAVKERGGMVAGKKIELVKMSSTGSPDTAVTAARKLIEQDKVQ
ncbi:MAG: transporter substrate-binding protein, partial [Rhizobacter sp.]|nr:transporter substrate-binding protein [Rhizobacter sp.]